MVDHVTEVRPDPTITPAQMTKLGVAVHDFGTVLGQLLDAVEFLQGRVNELEDHVEAQRRELHELRLQQGATHMVVAG
jgi:hypothetical protein